MATYLPTPSLTPTWTFFQFASTVGALETALRAAYTDQNVQVYASDQNAGNALVVVNDVQVISVVANNWVGYNQGFWQQKTPAKMAGGPNSDFTAYP